MPFGTAAQHRWTEFVPDKSFPRLVFGRRPETNEETPQNHSDCRPHCLFHARPWQAEQINKRRTDAARCINKHAWEADGSQVHVGNQVAAEQIVPAMVVAVWGSTPESAVNLKVMLDGSDDYWVTSTSVEDERTGHDGARSTRPAAITGCPTRWGRRRRPQRQALPERAASMFRGGFLEFCHYAHSGGATDHRGITESAHARRQSVAAFPLFPPLFVHMHFVPDIANKPIPVRGRARTRLHRSRAKPDVLEKTPGEGQI